MPREFRVTSTTHPTGDLREPLTYGQALDYATELVEAGLSPEIRRYSHGCWHPVSWEELHHLED